MKSYIGVDVGKHHLEIHFQNDHVCWPNSKQGIDKLIEYYHQVSSPHEDELLIAFEATGGYERLLKNQLQTKGLPYCILHPNKIRSFAKAKGLLAKTDKLDAQLIMHYARVMQPDASTPKENLDVKELLKRREQLISDKNQEHNRLDKEYHSTIKRSIKNHIKWLEKEIESVEKSLDLQKINSFLRQEVKLLTSIPGIGELTALYILAYMPEIKCANKQQLTALAGLAPMNRDSGSFRGKRYIQGGRAPLRRALYMSAVPSVRFNPELKDFYQKLRKKGKSAKVALVAVMRKLLILAASVLTRQTGWKRVEQHV